MTSVPTEVSDRGHGEQLGRHIGDDTMISSYGLLRKPSMGLKRMIACQKHRLELCRHIEGGGHFMAELSGRFNV